MFGFPKLQEDIRELARKLELVETNTSSCSRTVHDVIVQLSALEIKLGNVAIDLTTRHAQVMDRLDAAVTRDAAVKASLAAVVGEVNEFNQGFKAQAETIKQQSESILKLELDNAALRREKEVLNTRVTNAETDLMKGKIKIDVKTPSPGLHHSLPPAPAPAVTVPGLNAVFVTAPAAPSAPAPAPAAIPVQRTLDLEPEFAKSSARPALPTTGGKPIVFLQPDAMLSTRKWLLGLSASESIRAADVIEVDGSPTLVLCNSAGDQLQIINIRRREDIVASYGVKAAAVSKMKSAEVMEIGDLIRSRDGKFHRMSDNVVTVPVIQVPDEYLVYKPRSVMELAPADAVAARDKLLRCKNKPVIESRYLRHLGFSASTWVSSIRSQVCGDGVERLVSKPKRHDKSKQPVIDREYVVTWSGERVELQDLSGNFITCLKWTGEVENSK